MILKNEINGNLGGSSKIRMLAVYLTIVSLSVIFVYQSTDTNIAFAQVNNNISYSNQPNIDATNLFNTKTMVLGNNVKTLVVLIPNEGHHGPNEEREARFLEQQFVPENAVINTGTTVAWFNGDVGHERTIGVSNADGKSLLFSTGEITDMQVSIAHTFNEMGTYDYESEGDPGVTMRGTITVDNIQSPVTNSDNSGVDTVGVLMVPTQDKNDYIQHVKDGGLTVDSTHDFSDLRGGQKGTGDVQTLIVWTSEGKDLNSVISTLSEISSTLPYS
jgi:plastocyanin